MKFWIVTPSYNQFDWLKLCVMSVADQATDGVKYEDLGIKQQSNLKLKTEQVKHRHEPITVHHHIQDALSSDGTQEFLKEHEANSSQLKANGYTFSYESISDNGMYDAINRGWQRAPDDVDVIAHLNCDEQYLPNALQTIAGFMTAHPKADVVLADMVVVNSDGSYICHRRALRPHAFTSRFCCGGSTATTFQRASVTKVREVFFDTSWRNFGDKVWYNALHKSGCRFAVCNQLVSLFAITGENLNWTEEGRREKRRYELEFLLGTGMGTQLVVRYLGLWRVFKEYKLAPPSSYSFYKQGDTSRSTVPIDSPRGLWGKKWA